MKMERKKNHIVSLILNSLKKKEIIFDNNYFLYKDFFAYQFIMFIY